MRLCGLFQRISGGSKRPELTSADRLRNGKGVTSEQIDVVENQRGEPAFVLRVNPEAFVSKLFKRSIEGVPKHDDVNRVR